VAWLEKKENFAFAPKRKILSFPVLNINYKRKNVNHYLNLLIDKKNKINKKIN
jgi:hypothetical protein